jgi:hypothetical protein
MKFTYRITEGATYYDAEVYAPLANGKEWRGCGGRFRTRQQAVRWARWAMALANQPV